jgi:hypothetical protein
MTASALALISRAISLIYLSETMNNNAILENLTLAPACREA